jgi:hypothetical protein
MRIAPAE